MTASLAKTVTESEITAVEVDPNLQTMTEETTSTEPTKADRKFSEKVLVDPKWVIPQAGAEAVPLGVLASIDLNGSGAETSFLETTIESTLGGVVLIAAYQSVLTLLKSETARRNGEITRVTQLKLVARTALEAGRSSAFTMLVGSAIVALLPWLGWPLAALGIVSGGLMTTRIANEFWNALTEEQQSELRKAAEKAKVNIENIMPKNKEAEVAVPVAA